MQVFLCALCMTLLTYTTICVCLTCFSIFLWCATTSGCHPHCVRADLLQLYPTSNLLWHVTKPLYLLLLASTCRAVHPYPTSDLVRSVQKESVQDNVIWGPSRFTSRPEARGSGPEAVFRFLGSGVDFFYEFTARRGSGVGEGDAVWQRAGVLGHVSDSTPLVIPYRSIGA